MQSTTEITSPRKTKQFKSLIERPLSILDIILFFLLFLFCFLTLIHEDILITAFNALNFLKGHISDFYDAAGVTATYMPSIFISFALWQFPLWVTGIINHAIASAHSYSLFSNLWLELFPILFSFGSIYLMYKICALVGLGRKKSKLCAFFFATSPIYFFSVYIFSQHDVITVFLMMLGLYYWLKDRRYLFALIFGISVTFKYFGLPVFIVAAVLMEKDIRKLIQLCLVFAAPFALEVLLFSGSEGFISYVFGFWGAKFPFTAGINNGAVNISLFVLGIAVIASMAFFNETKGRIEQFKYLIYYAGWIYFLFFGICFWNPQYVVMGVPFWVLGTFLNKRSDFFMLLDIALMFFYTIYTVTTWENNVDQTMFLNGIFRKALLTHPFDKLTMAGLMEIMSTDMSYTLMSAILLVNAIFKHPKYWVSDLTVSIDHLWGLVRARFLVGVGIFLIPAIFVLLTALYGPMLSPIGEINDTIGPMMMERTVSETFTAQRASLKEIQIQFGVDPAAIEDSKTIVEIVDMETFTQIFETTIDNKTIKDEKKYKVDTGSLTLTPEKEYAINIIPIAAEGKDAVTIYHTTDKDFESEGRRRVNVDDTYQLYDLAIWLYGD